MFDVLRERIFSVVKDGVNVFKSDNEASSSCNEVNVNINAGAAILRKYQDEWAAIHSSSEQNVNLSEKLALQINSMHNKCETFQKTICDLNAVLNDAASMSHILKNCVKKVQDLQEQFYTIETALIQLEDIMESSDLQEKQLEHRFQLALYKEKKLANLELVRQELTAKHAQFMLDCEHNERQSMQERQKVCQEAFENDMQAFKQGGIIPKVLSKVEEKSLEDVHLECSTEELDDFLNK